MELARTRAERPAAPPEAPAADRRAVDPDARRTHFSGVHAMSDDADAVERALASRAAAGDRAAFREIYDRYLPRVIRQVTRVVGPGADVDDVTQDVFVQIHRSLQRFRGDSKLSTWIYRLTFNVSISHRRRRRQVVDLTAISQMRLAFDDWNRLEARDMCRALDAALHGVSDEAREAFFLVDVEGMKLREAAELTGVPLNTIAARVRRTRERLRQSLDRVAPTADDQRVAR